MLVCICGTARPDIPALVTRQVSLLGSIECEQGRKLVNTFYYYDILYGTTCITMYKLSIPGHN